MVESIVNEEDEPPAFNIVYVTLPPYWAATYRLVPDTAIEFLINPDPGTLGNPIANKTLPVGLYFTINPAGIEAEPDVGIVDEDDTFPAPSIVTVEPLI